MISHQSYSCRRKSLPFINDPPEGNDDLYGFATVSSLGQTFTVWSRSLLSIFNHMTFRRKGKGKKFLSQNIDVSNYYGSSQLWQHLYQSEHRFYTTLRFQRHFLKIPYYKMKQKKIKVLKFADGNTPWIFKRYFPKLPNYKKIEFFMFPDGNTPLRRSVACSVGKNLPTRFNWRDWIFQEKY